MSSNNYNNNNKDEEPNEDANVRLQQNNDNKDNNNDSDDDNVEKEDRPMFRSVAMMPSIQQPSFTPPSSSLPFHVDFNSLRMNDADVQKTLQGQAAASAAPRTTKSSTSFDPTKLKTPSTVSTWKLPKSPDCLPSVPTDYTLKRGYRQVIDTPQAVSGRISDTLRAHSIQVKYVTDLNQGLVLADCTSFANDLEPLHFHVRLFASKDSKDQEKDASGEDKDGVIVHVHRMCGCGFSFRDECRAILDAAEGIAPTSTPTQGPGPSCPSNMFTIPPSILEKKPALDTQVLQEAVANAATHLESNNRSMQMFALQHLASMTDPSKSSESTANEVSKMIMSNPEGVRKSLAILLIQGSLTFDKSEQDPSERYGDESSTHSHQMKHLGLTILSNLMTSISSNGMLEYSMTHNQAESNFFTNDLMPALFKDVLQFETCALNASLASKSLSILFRHSSSARNRCRSSGCVIILENAVKFGKERNARLMEEAANAILNVDRL